MIITEIINSTVNFFELQKNFSRTISQHFVGYNATHMVATSYCVWVGWSWKIQLSCLYNTCTSRDQIQPWLLSFSCSYTFSRHAIDTLDKERHSFTMSTWKIISCCKLWNWNVYKFLLYHKILICTFNLTECYITQNT